MRKYGVNQSFSPTAWRFVMLRAVHGWRILARGKVWLVKWALSGRSRALIALACIFKGLEGGGLRWDCRVVCCVLVWVWVW